MPLARTVRVTKRFTFEMAHALRCHDGQCANIHGHSYVLDVTIAGTPAHAPGHPKDGMVIDFADLKAIIDGVVGRFDHAVINDLPPFDQRNTTAELLAQYVFEEVGPLLPPGRSVRRVEVCETETSCAIYEP